MFFGIYLCIITIVEIVVIRFAYCVFKLLIKATIYFVVFVFAVLINVLSRVGSIQSESESEGFLECFLLYLYRIVSRALANCFGPIPFGD